jgi:hypothetical protein
MSHETGCRCWDCLCKLPEEFSKLQALHDLLIDERNALRRELAEMTAARDGAVKARLETDAKLIWFKQRVNSPPEDILQMVRTDRDRIREQRDQAWADAKADRQTVLTLQRGMQALLDSTWARPTTPLTPFGEITITHRSKDPGGYGPNPNYRSNP